MNEKIAIRCTITNSDASELGMRITLDGQVVFDQDWIRDPVNFECWLEDTEQQHQLTFEMRGKTHAHTELDSDQNIVKDAHLTLTDFSVDEIDLEFFSNFSYTHDLNGTGPERTEAFYGYMGCNGTVTVQFSTPIYLWLLENL